MQSVDLDRNDVVLGQIGPHPIIEMRLRQALKRRETADFESPLPTCAGTRASGRRTARPNCRVATFITIRFTAH